MTLTNKIDFGFIIWVKNANPNGDPLNGNRPRTDYNGMGEITDVCIKRKVRDRLLEAGQNIFVQSDDRKIDAETSLRNRAESLTNGLGKDAFKKVSAGKKPRKKPAKNGSMFAPSDRSSLLERRVRMLQAYRSLFAAL